MVTPTLVMFARWFTGGASDELRQTKPTTVVSQVYVSASRFVEIAWTMARRRPMPAPMPSIVASTTCTPSAMTTVSTINGAAIEGGVSG